MTEVRCKGLDHSQQNKLYMSIKLFTYLFVYFFILKPIDFFTDTVAILNKLDLRSIVGCPGGISIYKCLLRHFFLKFS